MKKQKKHRNCFSYLFCGSVFLLLLGRIGVFAIQKHYQDKVDLVSNFPASSQIYDRDGNLLYEYYDEIRRIPVDPEQFPEYLVQATLQAEDEYFFEHPGFDPIGIVRAFWRNAQAGEIKEGASTIGQQLVKNTINGPSEGYRDKLDEMFFSIALDMKFAKQDIIDLYLNTIPYGSNVYGVEAASRLYFKKHVNELTVQEAATLAALPKAPSIFSPYDGDQKALMNRRDYILHKMLNIGAIDQTQYDEAIASATKFASAQVELKDPHFVMYVKDKIDRVYGDSFLSTNGVEIRTTIDPSIQKKLEDVAAAKEELLGRVGADNLGAIAIDPKTGEVLGMVGNVDYFDTLHAGNYNMTTAQRQPGSAFKPIVYAKLLDRDAYTPASILYDVPTNFTPNDEKPYIPKNYDNRFRGPVTIRSALAQSLNIPAVQAIMLAGVDSTLDFAEDIGINTLQDRKRFGTSLVLGGAEVRLMELASAYGTFANGGEYMAPETILQIVDYSGYEYEWRTQAPRQVIQPETAYQITSILSDNEARTPVFGSRSSLAFADRTVAAKTGTSQDYRDAWTIGYTPSIVIGVWVGNYDNRPLVYGSPGAIAAAPIWRAMMDAYAQDHEKEEFELPKYIEKKKIQTILGAKEDYVAWWQLDAANSLLALNAKGDLPFRLLLKPKTDDGENNANMLSSH